MVNKFFSEMFVDEDRRFVPFLPRRYDGSPICSIEFKTEKVYAKLSSLNSCKSPGPDGCHSRVLKETAEQLATPLAIPTLSKIF